MNTKLNLRLLQLVKENQAGTVKKNQATKEAMIYRQCMDNQKVAHLNVKGTTFA